MAYSHDVCLAMHAHRHAYVTFVIEGLFEEKYPSRNPAICRGGAVRFLPAAEKHENRIRAGTRCLHIGSAPETVEQLRQLPLMPDRPTEVNNLATSWLAHRLYAEFARQDAASAMALEGLILEILAEISRSEDHGHSVDAPQWLRRATEIVETRFLERLCLADIASEVGVHYVHLSRQFHKYNRCTVGELIRRRRVQHACQLLAYSRTPLADIALTCGFSDQSHLSFLFKRYMGLSPSKFRSLAFVHGAAEGSADTDNSTEARQAPYPSLQD
jgi:AraC family transcriptional regulator